LCYSFVELLSFKNRRKQWIKWKLSKIMITWVQKSSTFFGLFHLFSIGKKSIKSKNGVNFSIVLSKFWK
jgi:hypothetical protein